MNVQSPDDREYIYRRTAWEDRRVSATGYASTLSMTDEEMEEAGEKEQRKQVGFRKEDS